MIPSIDRLPPITGPSPIAPARPKVQEQGTAQDKHVPFQDVLTHELTGGDALKFSGHAQSRLLARQIQLSPEQIARLQGGVHQAQEKGARDSLVMLDNLAFIVSIPNRTVVTALDGAARAGNVFTQIDSAVIV
jgi:flagellar operon protein